MSQETPLSRFNSQAKRARIDNGSDDLSPMLVQAARSGKVPEQLEGFLFKMLNDFRNLQAQVVSLQDQVNLLSDENKSLKEKVANCSVASVTSPDPFVICETVERDRAVVLGNVTESSSHNPVTRNEEDHFRVRQIFNSLGVEAQPTAVFRMGAVGTRPRLLKAILPSSRLQKQVVKRAPWLRDSGFRGVWLRESLTKEERDRRRAARVGQGTSRPPVNRIRPGGGRAYGQPPEVQYNRSQLSQRPGNW